MKKILLFTISIVTIIIIYYPQNINGSSSGSPGGKTNSPIDMFNCTQCHTGASLNSGIGNISVTSDIPQAGYIPGETYTITTTINQSGSNQFGFELTSENNLSMKSGIWTITEMGLTKKINNDVAVTHTANGTAGTNTKSWSVDWTAPGFGASTGDITFYAAGIAANNNGNNSGDNVYATSYTVSEQIFTSIKDPISKNLEIIHNENKIYIQNNIALENIKIINMNGKIVLSIENILAPYQIQTNNIKKGIYIIKAIDEHSKSYMLSLIHI